jgi:hypothetical protein
MYIEDFSDIVFRLKSDIDFRENYLNRLRDVDSNLIDVIIDNKYVDSTLMQTDFLIDKVFGELTEHVFWYLYDWRPGFSIEHDGVNYIIEDFDDFVEATEQMYQLPMRPKLEKE